MQVLNDIVNSVRARLVEQKNKLSLSDCVAQAKKCRALRGSVLPLNEALNANALGIIAEVKFASPSEGVIWDIPAPIGVAGDYLQSGAAALSVLTEEDHFMGSLIYLQQIREKFPAACLLRKDFIVESYQVAQAAAYGADTYLLIAALLDLSQLKELIEYGRSFGMEPLVEVHDEPELQLVLAAGARIIGVNNRNLKTMKVNLATSEELIKHKPSGTCFISESGLKSYEDVAKLRNIGFDGFLVGTYFMKSGKPGLALKNWLASGARSDA